MREDCQSLSNDALVPFYNIIGLTCQVEPSHIMSYHTQIGGSTTCVIYLEYMFMKWSYYTICGGDEHRHYYIFVVDVPHMPIRHVNLWSGLNILI